MPTMSLRSNNSLLWLVLGLSLGFVAARRIVRNLYEVRDLTEITRSGNDERMISKGTEDALKLETLQKLTESPSYELRGASLRIIAERASKEQSWDILLEDLRSKHKPRRNRAINAIHFLVASRACRTWSNASPNMSPRLHDVTTYKAIVDCLCGLLDEHTVENTTTESPILPKTRPPGEKKLLATLNILLLQDIPAALEAGLVSQWLAKYPFPCLRKDHNTTAAMQGNDYRRRDVGWMMKMYWPDDHLMSSIFTTLVGYPDGVRQLRKYGLMGSMMEEEKDIDDHGVRIDPESDDDKDGDSDVWMVNGESTAGTALAHEPMLPDEESFEEQALRRRRREAMVFSEDGGPIGSENIIQPPL